MVDKKKDEAENKNCVSLEITDRLCEARCKICSSEYLKEIHDLKQANHSHVDISKILETNFSVQISTASLSRHFSKYEKRKDLVTAEIINNDLIEEATARAVHNKNLLILIQTGFVQIMGRIKSGRLILDISDLDKVMKLYYQVIGGQETDEKDFIAVFQKATDKYGLKLEQGVLFNQSSSKSSS